MVSELALKIASYIWTEKALVAEILWLKKLLEAAE